MHHLFFAFQKLIILSLIDNAEDLDIVMPMYNLLEYSKNYRKTTGIFWNYYKDEPNSSNVNIQLKILNLLITKQILQEN